MAQQNEVRGVHTSVLTEDGVTKVFYRGTTVVAFTLEEITLQSNGWRTNTTKTRMTQASNQFGLGYSIYQKDYSWYVKFRGETFDYGDGMTLFREGSRKVLFSSQG